MLPRYGMSCQITSVLPHLFYLFGRFIYLWFYVAFNTVQVISRRVVRRAEETSTYNLLGFCTVNCRPTASNYQLSHLRLCRESNPGLRGGRRFSEEGESLSLHKSLPALGFIVFSYCLCGVNPTFVTLDYDFFVGLVSWFCAKDTCKSSSLCTIGLFHYDDCVPGWNTMPHSCHSESRSFH